ncbi:MAG: HNH endonuclease, partial [Limnochordia bacterium]
CGATNVPFEIEHIVPKSRVGTNQVSNLAIACKKCNLKKGNKTAEESGYPDVQKQAKQPLRDAAAVNAMRLALLRRLEVLSLPLETGSGAETKYNRIQQGHPKAHWIDAACVGASGSEVILNPDYTVLVITATGRGSRQMCSMDKYGFPRSKPKAVKRVHGFQTGDMVKVVIEKGKYQGVYIGRAVVKGSGYFDVATSSGKKISTSWKRFRLLQRFDGYAYDCRRTTTSVRLK